MGTSRLSRWLARERTHSQASPRMRRRWPNWGYQLYGGRLLPIESVRAMMTQPSTGDIAPDRGYGLGTMVFMGLSPDATYGHSGLDPGYTSLLAVVPARHLAAAVLIPDSGRDTESIMRDLPAVLG